MRFATRTHQKNVSTLHMIFVAVNWPEIEADHSSTSIAEINNACSCNSTTPFVCVACCSIKFLSYTLRMEHYF